MNTMLANLITKNVKENYFVSCSFMFCLVFTFVILDFKFEDITSHTITSLVLSSVFACLLAPFYVYFSRAIMNETIEEAKLLYNERDSFRQLFDALQECIIVA